MQFGGKIGNLRRTKGVQDTTCMCYWGSENVNANNRHFFVSSGDGRRMRNLLLFSEAIMDKRYPALENSRPLEPFIDRFAKELVQERIDSGQIAVKNMSFAEMKMLSHQIGRRVAQHLGHQMTSLQSELYSDDYCCPTCGLESVCRLDACLLAERGERRHRRTDRLARCRGHFRRRLPRMPLAKLSAVRWDI